MNVYNERKITSRAEKKLTIAIKRMKLKRFLRRAKQSFSIAQRLGDIVSRYSQKCSQEEAILESKTRIVHERVRREQMISFLRNLTKNKYIQRMVDMEYHKRIESEETKQFIEKMKTLNSMEVEAIRN